MIVNQKLRRSFKFNFLVSCDVGVFLGVGAFIFFLEQPLKIYINSQLLSRSLITSRNYPPKRSRGLMWTSVLTFFLSTSFT